MALVGEGDWNRRPGGQAAAARHQRVRPAGTREKYDRWVVFWQEFCRLGGPGGAYPEFEWEELTPLNKFKLFLGWLEETRRCCWRSCTMTCRCKLGWVPRMVATPGRACGLGCMAPPSGRVNLAGTAKSRLLAVA